MYRSLDTEIIKNRAAYIERIEKFLEIRREVGWRLWLGFDFIVCFRTCAVRTISKRSRNREKKFRYFLCAVHPRINKDRLFLDLRKLVPLRNFLQKPLRHFWKIDIIILMIPGWKKLKEKKVDSKEKYSRERAKERDEGIRGSRVGWVEDLRWGSRLIFVATSGDLGDSRRKKGRRILFSFIAGCSSSRRIIEGSELLLGHPPHRSRWNAANTDSLSGRSPAILFSTRLSSLSPESASRPLVKNRELVPWSYFFSRKKKRKTVSPKKLWRKSSFFFGERWNFSSRRARRQAEM